MNHPLRISTCHSVPISDELTKSLTNLFLIAQVNILKMSLLCPFLG